MSTSVNSSVFSLGEKYMFNQYTFQCKNKEIIQMYAQRVTVFSTKVLLSPPFKYLLKSLVIFYLTLMTIF